MWLLCENHNDTTGGEISAGYKKHRTFHTSLNLSPIFLLSQTAVLYWITLPALLICLRFKQVETTYGCCIKSRHSALIVTHVLLCWLSDEADLTINKTMTCFLNQLLRRKRLKMCKHVSWGFKWPSGLIWERLHSHQFSRAGSVNHFLKRQSLN